MVKIFTGIMSELPANRRVQLILLVILSVLASFLEAASIGAFVPFLTVLLDPVDTSKNFEFFIVSFNFGDRSERDMQVFFTAVFILFVFASFSIRAIHFWYQSYISLRLGGELSAKLFNVILSKTYGELVTEDSSAVLANVKKAKDLVGHFFQPLLSLISGAIYIVGILLVLLFLDPVVVLSLALSLGFLYGTAVVLCRSLLVSNSVKYADEMQVSNRLVQYGLGALRDIVIRNLKEIYTSNYKKSVMTMQNIEAQNAIIALLPKLFVEAFGLILLSIFILVFSLRGESLPETIPLFAAFALGAQKLLPIVQQVYSASASMLGGRQSCEDVLAVLKSNGKRAAVINSTYEIRKLKNSIQLSNVSYKFQSRNDPSIRNINLKIEKGEHVAIVGQTASGKSTLMDVIIGLLEPTHGQIMVDGEQVNGENVHRWFGNITFVPQSIFLINGTVLENINFGDNNLSQNKLDLALDVSDLRSDISEKRLSLGSYVGERGSQLSGGQRQRVGIARAIYCAQEVLFFDEATSALDIETERRILSNLKKLLAGNTVLYITHRLNVLENFDRIIEMNNGCIIFDGNYNDWKKYKNDH